MIILSTLSSFVMSDSPVQDLYLSQPADDFNSGFPCGQNSSQPCSDLKNTILTINQTIYDMIASPNFDGEYYFKFNVWLLKDYSAISCISRSIAIPFNVEVHFYGVDPPRKTLLKCDSGITVHIPFLKKVTYSNIHIRSRHLFLSEIHNCIVNGAAIYSLSSEQARAFKIVDSHLTDVLVQMKEAEQVIIRNSTIERGRLGCLQCTNISFDDTNILQIDDVQLIDSNQLNIVKSKIVGITLKSPLRVFNAKTIFISQSSLLMAVSMEKAMQVEIVDCNVDLSQARSPSTNLGLGKSIFTFSLLLKLFISRTRFINNVHNIGTLRFQFIGRLFMNETEISNNKCGSSTHAVVAFEDCTKIFIFNSTFSNNRALQTGAIYASYGSLEIEKCIFENNTSIENGGALVSMFTETKITSSIFRNNLAMNGRGGALYLYNLDFLLKDSTLMNNQAQLSGGAIAIENSHRCDIYYCDLLYNQVVTRNVTGSLQDGIGGALAATRSNTIVHYSNFLHNVALFGGAIACESTPDLYDSMFDHNLAHYAGGAIFAIPFTSRYSFTRPTLGKAFRNNMALSYGPNMASPITDYNVSINDDCQQTDDHSLSSMEATKNLTLYFGEEFCIRFYGAQDAYHNSVSEVFETVDIHSMTGGSPVTPVLLSVNPKENMAKVMLKLAQNSKYYSIQRFRVETYLVSTEFSLTIRDCPTDWIIENGICTQGIRFSLIIPLVIFGGISAMLLSFVLGIFMSFHFVKLLIWLRKIYKRERVEKDIEKKLLDYDFGNLTNEGILTTNHSLHHDHDSSQHQQGDYYELETCSDIHSLSNKKKHLPLLSSFSKNNSSNTLSLIIPSSELKFEKKIGEGASGSVYLAQWNSNRVAVKTLSRDDDYSSMDEFEKEITVLIQLRHPNIINFYGIFISEFKKYMVVEYLQGGSLDNLIKKMKNQNVIISMKEKMKILIGIASGMKYLHNLQPAIIHRDLKPGNILLTSDYTAKIADFGLSKTISMNTCNSLTTNIGTLFYMAPELLLGTDISSENVQEYATKTDVFSFSIIMWELLFEENPYHNDDSQKIHFFSNQQHDRNKNGSNNSRKHVNSLNFLSLILKEGNRPIIPFKSNSNNHFHHHHDENTAMNSSVNDNNNNNITWQMEDETEMKIWCEKFLQNSSPPFLSFMKGYISLMEECWNEDPLQRPGFNRILEILYTLNQFL
ncbi:hypothetical protein C9374_004657 [Naegleria lovaniensis]|uniref:Protein kinase domain-containing protein n=1 Tax=Naegleria lovaniensis TaxID=51637 RepID=A0AA88GMZ1_NAELO|nr:uncharacterized protein C9374_004657 [Naegleria lovaniensis]KAG2383320.1 hypothetical protein C9374_004657 [Naegleria lovaniensis]